MPTWSAFADIDPTAPGLIAGVGKAGTIERFLSAGVAAQGGESLAPDTRFYVASVAKQFAAAAIGSLALDGRLGLGDSVRRWLPELSSSWQPVLGELARRALFAEADMTDSRFLDTPGPSSVPGWVGGSRRVDIQFTCCGDGGLVTSLADLARWDAWLPTSRLRPLMLTSRPALPGARVAHDAWGISIRRHHGFRIESHGGSIDGYLATFVRVPAAAVAIIVLANTDRFGVTDFGRRTRELADSILGDLLDRGQPPWTETHGQPVDERVARNLSE